MLTNPFRSQTMNLIINLDHDDWILSDLNKTLVEVGAGMSCILSLSRCLYIICFDSQ